MSFSYETKNELCRLAVQKRCCAKAEAYGVLLYAAAFTMTEVRIVTENPQLAARLPRLFRRAFGLAFDRLPDPDLTAGKRIFQITQREKLHQIVNALGYDPQQNLVLHINFGLLEDGCDRAAFLRGAFFAGGSVTDPQKRYHLELATSHWQVSREMEALLRECGYPPKSVGRSGSRVTYFKQSRRIEEFLTFIGAPVAAMEIMSAKVEKDLRNSVNRRLNCDSANLDKSVEAAREQVETIRRLERAGILEDLPEKLRETAALRLSFPELSLSELAERFDPPVSKSCLNHRLRRLTALAQARLPEEDQRPSRHEPKPSQTAPGADGDDGPGSVSTVP